MKNGICLLFWWPMKSTKNEINQKNMECTWPMRKFCVWRPNATYIPLTCVWVLRWGNANFMFGVGCFRVSRYQHVGFPNARPQREEFCVAVEYRLK